MSSQSAPTHRTLYLCYNSYWLIKLKTDKTQRGFYSIFWDTWLTSVRCQAPPTVIYIWLTEKKWLWQYFSPSFINSKKAKCSDKRRWENHFFIIIIINNRLYFIFWQQDVTTSGIYREKKQKHKQCHQLQARLHVRLTYLRHGIHQQGGLL